MIIKRGNLDMIDIGFTPNNAYITAELMVERSITLRFEITERVDLRVGDYIEFEGEQFTLYNKYIPEINKQTNGYSYDIKFYDFQERLKNYVVKYENNLSFNLARTGGGFIDLIIANVPFMAIVRGEFPLDIKNIFFDSIDVFSALNTIAEEYGVEWWFNGNVLNFGTLNIGTAISLSYDVELDDISVQNSENTLITRLYARGGTRNLPLSYGGNLRIPPIDLYPQMADVDVVEGIVYFDVYPRQENTIVTVDEVFIPDEEEPTEGTWLYTIKGNNTFTLTEADIISGKPLMIAFTSGLLAGEEFELIIRPDNTFEIVYEEHDNDYRPNETYKPVVGNTFFFFNFKAESIMPTLITEAEEELEILANDYLDNQKNEFVYDIAMRSIEAEKKSIDMQIGQRVTLVSPTMESVSSRVQKYTKSLINKYEASYQIGDSPVYSRLASLETNVERNTYKMLSGLGLTFEQVKAVVETEGAKQFISKIANDIARGHISFEQGLSSKEISTFLKGLEIGDYQKGLLGTGGIIDEYGNAELTSLTLRRFLEVPELRYNKVQVYTGIRWDTFGAGIISEIEIDKDAEGNELQSGTITLKLEDGEFGAIAVDDLCQGIFHNFNGANDAVSEDQKNGNFKFAGFSTSYFRITEILDGANSQFRYTLRGASERWTQQNHPKPFMHFACYANPSNTDRQSSTYTTTDYTIRLKNMTTWEYGADNIYEISGKLDGFQIGETILEGEGQAFGNAYIWGTLQKVYNDPVRMEINNGGDGFLALGENMTIICKVMRGWEDITDTVETWSVTRETGNQTEDTAWNIAHTNFNGTLEITHTKQYTDLGSGLSTLFIFTAKTGDNIASFHLTI